MGLPKIFDLIAGSVAHPLIKIKAHPININNYCRDKAADLKGF
jgi:hypothetical protein